MARLPWPEYFMNITRLVAERATCSRRKVGAIAVKDKRILALLANSVKKIKFGYPSWPKFITVYLFTTP